MPDYELAELKLDEALARWQKKHELKDFEVVDIVLRHWLSIYHRERCMSEAKDVQKVISK
jgi:hypothetical protein